MAYVVVDAEAVVVDPYRGALEGNVGQPLPVTGDVVEARGDVAADTVDVDGAVGSRRRARFEARYSGHVHVGGRRLQREEGGVQR